MTTPPESSTRGGPGLPVRGNRAVLDAVAAATRIRRGHDRPPLDEAVIRAPLDEPLVERFSREARAVQMNVVPAQTAALLGLDCATEPDIKEMNWGAWEGHTRAELDRKYGGEVARRAALGLDLRPHDGETPRELRDRVSRWLKRVAASARPTGATP